MTDGWSDSTTFWRDQRVAVTGRRGALCVGSFIVEKLHARGAAEVFVPRIEEQTIRELLRDYMVRKISSLQREVARFKRKYGMRFERFGEYLHERSIKTRQR